MMNYCSSDCVIFTTESYDFLIFNPVYSHNNGVYLFCEGDKPIKYLYIINSCLYIHYMDDTEKTIGISVSSVVVDDNIFKRKYHVGVEGCLLRYGVEDALKYNLDVQKAFPDSKIIPKIRKRSM